MHRVLLGLFAGFLGLCFLSAHAATADDANDRLAGTKPLTMEGDIAAGLVAGVDKFLLREIDQAIERQDTFWKRDFDSAEKYNESVEPNRQRLAHILGVRDARVPFDGLEIVGTTAQSALVGRGKNYKIYSVRWPVIRDIHGEGLMLVPDDRKNIVANIVAIPDADQTPEMIAGLVDGVKPPSQFARRLAASGCRVIVPTLISREMKRRAAPGRGGGAVLTNREYLYRSSFELGRHLSGYEIQKVLALVDWFDSDAASKDGKAARIGVVGYGEGGMLAMYAAALDTRIDAACVSGYFGSRKKNWDQPLDRNVFGLLERFSDWQVASLIAPRSVVIDSHEYPEVELPSQGGGPAHLVAQAAKDVASEFGRLHRLAEEFEKVAFDARTSDDRGKSDAYFHFLDAITKSDTSSKKRWEPAFRAAFDDPNMPEHLREDFDPAPRQQRQIHEIDDHNQWLLRESPYVRRQFMNIGLVGADRKDGKNKLDTSSPEKYEASVERFREFFRDEVVGHFDHDFLPFNARSRKTYDEEKWTGYEVMLDVFPDVVAYGILILPKDLKPGEKRPVVVCQHGLEGRPQDIVTGDHRAYHDFAAKLAERGFITFAPQNLYIGRDDFRTLQRKANTIQKTLFSVIVPQHQQIVNWLKEHPNVDDSRIAFYGLSYGGKSAMRIPPLVPDYCLSICSADFNEWVWKNTSTRARYSYMFTGEYEIFEFDLGSTFNYAEMAALIAPRPFMVERGHHDGVAPDETVGYEFARVRHLYAARLGLPDRCEIEWFLGPHTINGKGTYDFLHRHLNWPKP